MPPHTRQKPRYLAEKLRAIRQGLEISQADMARVLQLTSARVCEYENNLRQPGVLTILSYARAAGVSVEQIIDDALTLGEIKAKQTTKRGASKMKDENQKSSSEEFEEFRKRMDAEHIERQLNNLADLKDAGDRLTELERRYSQAVSDFTDGECIGVVKFD